MQFDITSRMQNMDTALLSKIHVFFVEKTQYSLQYLWLLQINIYHFPFPI